MEWEEKKSLKSVIAVPAMSQILPFIERCIYIFECFGCFGIRQCLPKRIANVPLNFFRAKTKTQRRKVTS
jgi:hypothetical protein